MKKCKKECKKKWIVIIALTILLMGAACFGYVNNYYHSNVNMQEFQSDGQVEIMEMQDGLYLNGPGQEHAIIFYPGAKVEYTSYLPLFYDLANEGIDCFLVEMPCNLAFLGQNKAENIIDSYDYEHWYLTGHSLGGAMAASYAAEHLVELDGLALLAAYPTKSLQSDSFSVVSLYGSEDGVLNMEKLEAGRSLMPSDYTEVCIEGGNHAWFGNYGEQKGDNTANISREEQQEQTVDAILQMIEGHKTSEPAEEASEQKEETSEQTEETSEQVKEAGEQTEEASEQVKEADEQTEETSEQVKEAGEQTEEASERVKEAGEQEKKAREQTKNDSAQEEKTMTYEQITAEEAKKIMEKEENILILDVRTREEFDTGHIKGAICLPNEEILEEPAELPDKEQTILVYCRSGNRSKQAAQKLADLGYENVLEFGGIIDWPYQE